MKDHTYFDCPDLSCPLCYLEEIIEEQQHDQVEDALYIKKLETKLRNRWIVIILLCAYIAFA